MTRTALCSPHCQLQPLLLLSGAVSGVSCHRCLLAATAWLHQKFSSVACRMLMAWRHAAVPDRLTLGIAAGPVAVPVHGHYCRLPGLRLPALCAAPLAIGPLAAMAGAAAAYSSPAPLCRPAAQLWDQLPSGGRALGQLAAWAKATCSRARAGQNCQASEHAAAISEGAPLPLMDNAPAPVSCVHGLGCDEISVSGTSSVCVTLLCMYCLRSCAVVVATARIWDSF